MIQSEIHIAHKWGIFHDIASNSHHKSHIPQGVVTTFWHFW